MGKKFSDEWKVKMSKSLSGKEVKSRRRFSEDVEKEICRLYCDEEKSTYWLGKQFSCNRNMISDIIKRNGLSIRKSNYTGHNNGCNKFTFEQEIEICSLYENSNVTRTEMSKMFNCGKTTIRDILLRHNINLGKV